MPRSAQKPYQKEPVAQTEAHIEAPPSLLFYTLLPLRDEPGSRVPHSRPICSDKRRLKMLSPAQAPNRLSVLHEQHHKSTAELARTHQMLSKLYKKLSKAERVLAERQERQLTRDQRKKWQYTRVLTKRTISEMELGQFYLHDDLQQLNELIAYHSSSWTTPWTGLYAPPPSAYSSLTPLSPIFTPYAEYRPAPRNQIQYWDLSGLPERSSSAHGSPSADSGYHEPAAQGLGIITEGQSQDNNEHRTDDEMKTAFAFNFESQEATENNSRDPSSQEQDDVVPDLQELVSPIADTSSSASASSRVHKRCVSANAAQLNLGSLAPSSPKRGASVGPALDRISVILERRA